MKLNHPKVGPKARKLFKQGTREDRDCPFCGEEKGLVWDSDYTLLDPELKAEVKTAAWVCQSCSKELVEVDDLIEYRNKFETESGKTYNKTGIYEGFLRTVTFH